MASDLRYQKTIEDSSDRNNFEAEIVRCDSDNDEKRVSELFSASGLQRDQIWRNFAKLAKIYKSLATFERFL